MGVYSTVDYTRQEALDRIADALEHCTDEELSGAMFAIFGDRELSNYRIVSNYEQVFQPVDLPSSTGSLGGPK